MRGTVELLVGERSGDLDRARSIQEKMLDTTLAPLVSSDTEYGNAIYGKSVLELMIVTDQSQKTLVVEVDAESAEKVIAAEAACKKVGASLVAAAVWADGEVVAGNFLPEQIPSPMLLVHLSQSGKP